MTTDSTKYFCKRGAVSARLNLVDASLSAEYRYDGEHGKYYFGARYFDPFFGMWMSPDPASVFFRETYTPLKCRSIIEKDILQRSNVEAVLLKQSFRASAQFSNPYTYGGDPVNFIDPTGLFALDVAFFSIGWDSNKGWNFGFSALFYSYTWNQNGSKTFTAGIDASTSLGFFVLGGDLGYSYNTYSGHSVSTGGHICLGAEGNCAGIEAGGGMNWDPYGNYLGATAYGGAFAELTLGDFNAKVNAGHEIGLMGMEGRGMYAGANVGAKGVSLYASWAENGGWNYGGGYRIEAWRYESSANASSLNLFGIEAFSLETQSTTLGLGTTGALSEYHDELIDDVSRYLLTNPNENTWVGHFTNKEGNSPLRTGFYDYVDQETKIHEGYHSIEQVASRFSSGAYGFDGSKDIRMYSCSLAKYGEAAKFSKLVPNYNIWAATNDIAVTRKQLNLLGVKTRYYSATILNGGTWQMYRNGSLVK